MSQKVARCAFSHMLGRLPPEFDPDHCRAAVSELCWWLDTQTGNPNMLKLTQVVLVAVVMALGYGAPNAKANSAAELKQLCN